jgi:F1F0 ATPase subunit 2
MSFAIRALLYGALLGAIFFGGLWWTIRRALTAANPTLWFACSLLLRMSLVLGGFYAIAAAGWQALVLSLVGCLLCRTVITRLARPTLKYPHAP